MLQLPKLLEMKDNVQICIYEFIFVNTLPTESFLKGIDFKKGGFRNLQMDFTCANKFY